MSDADLMTEAFVLLEAARARAPLTPEAYRELATTLDAVARRADEPDDIRIVTGEQLAWLEPGGEHEMPLTRRR